MIHGDAFLAYFNKMWDISESHCISFLLTIKSDLAFLPNKR